MEKRERNIKDLACNSGMWSDWESNQRPLGLQNVHQSTDPHQLEQKMFIINYPATLEILKLHMKP